MVTKAQINKYGKEESQEHGVPLKFGKKIAKDHFDKYGGSYYKAIDKVEKGLLKKKK